MSFINSFLFVSLSLISEDVPKIALRGFGFVFFFLLIQLGSIANSDTNRITFWRGPCPVVRAAHRDAQLHFPALQFALFPTAPPPPFQLIVNTFEKTYLFCKNYRLKKKKRKRRKKKEGGKLCAILIFGLFSVFVTILVSQCFTS